MDPALWGEVEGPPDDVIAALMRLVPGARAPDRVRIVTQFDDIATVRLRRRDLLAVREDPAVASLKAPRPMVPDRPSTDGRKRRQRAQRSLGNGGPTGRGAIVGIVDWGCDFTHPNLLTSTGRTRLLALWDQRARGRSPAPYGYGVVHGARRIDRALATSDPFAALDYDPLDADEDGNGSHGTHVIDIAAGRPSVGPGGVAPGAQLVFVHLAALAWGPRHIASSVCLLEAIDFIARIAGDRPWVINLSLGSHAGPHDGTTLVEKALDAIVTSGPGRVIVQSCGNYAQRPIHSAGRLAPGERRRLRWHVDPSDLTPNEIELWYAGADAIAMNLIAPDGRRIARALPGSHGPIIDGARPIGRFAHRRHDPNNGDNQASLIVEPQHAGHGPWHVELEALAVTDGNYHLWIERDEVSRGSQSRLDRRDFVQATTLGTICNGHHTISVGAYDPKTRAQAWFSSRGPTRDGRAKPDILARGVDVPGARSAPEDDEGTIDDLLTHKTGTSMASPHVAGATAVLYEAAGRPLTAAEVKRILVESGARAGDGPPLLDLEAAVKLAKQAPEVAIAKPAPARAFGEAMFGEDAPVPGSVVVPHSKVVGSIGITFEAADARQTWVGGQPLAPQVTALILSGMVKAGSLTPELVKAVTPLTSAMDWQGIQVNRNAHDKERIGRFHLVAHHAFMVVTGLEAGGTPLAFTADELGRLERAVAVLTVWLRTKPTWKDHPEAPYPWMSDDMLRSFAWSRRKYVDEIYSAIDWKLWRTMVAEAFATRDNQLAPWNRVTFPEPLQQAMDRLRNAWTDAIEPYLAIRDEANRIHERGYNSLWPWKAKQKRTQPAGDKEPHDPTELRRFLAYAWIQKPSLARAARDSESARKDLLAAFARYSAVAALEAPTTGRSGALADAPGLANAPALPATLSSSPPVSAPDFFMPVGAELRCTMALEFPDVFEAFLDVGYRWELVRIPDETIKAATDRGDQLGWQTTSEDAPGFGDVIGNQLDRRYGYAVTDVRRVWAELDSSLGGAKVGAAGLVVVGSIAGFIGEVLVSFFEWINQKQYEKRIALTEPGMFLLRCIAFPRPGEDAARFRPPTARYLPIWVRSVAEVSAAEAARLYTAIEDQIKALEERKRNSDDANEKAEIDKAIKQLREQAKLSVAEELDAAAKELREYIRTTKIPADAEFHVKKSLEDAIDKAKERLAELDSILYRRAGWYTELEDAVRRPSEREMIRLRGALVTDEGVLVRLMVDAWQHPTKPKRYHVFDSTDPRGWTAHRDHADRATAIRNALKSILETDAHNHGRGHCTIYVPLGGGAVQVVEFRVDLDASAALIYSIETSVQLATAIALLVAAATGGTVAIGLLLPLGIIGAVPSLYRLVTKVKEGNLTWDTGTVMELIDVVGSLVGVGQAAAGALKLVHLSEGFMIMGVGLDGLGAIMMGTTTLAQIMEAKKIEPPAARRAQIMRIMSSALLGVGMMKLGSIVGRMAEHAHAKAFGASTEVPLPRADLATNKHFEGLVGAPVPVHVEGETPQGAKPIRFEHDGYGLPSELRLVLPEGNATPKDAEPHAPAVRAILRMDEVCGGVRKLLDNVDSLKVKGSKFPDKSRAAAAKRAIEAAPGELDTLAKLLADGAKPEEIDAKVAALRDALIDHEQTLQELAGGKKFVAAQAGTENQAIAAGYDRAPPGHYYVAKPDGGFDLRRIADADVDPVPAKPPKPKQPDPPKPKGKKPSKPAPPAPAKRRRIPYDPPRVLAAAAKLGLDPAKITFKPAPKRRKDVRVKPPVETGAGYEIHARPNATDAEIAAALVEHVRLSDLRPKKQPPTSDPKSRRIKKRLWSAEEEAAWRGRPPAEEGYRWVWQKDGLDHWNKPGNGGRRRKYNPKLDRFVTAGKTRGAPPFDANETPAGAFDKLGGNSPADDFGRWVATVTGENGALAKILGLKPGEGLPRPDGKGRVTRAWLESQITAPGGKKPGAIEAALRKPLQPLLDAAIRDKPKLRAPYKDLWNRVGAANAPLADAVVSHQAMLDLTGALSPREGGHVANKWFLDELGDHFGPAGHQREVPLGEDVLRGYGLPTDYQPILDALFFGPRTTAHETKHGKALLIIPDPMMSQRTRRQWEVFSKLQGGQIKDKQGVVRPVDAMQYAFTHPEGVKTNADWFAQQLVKGQAPVDFVLFDRERGHRVFGFEEVQARVREGLTAQQLADEIRAFVDGPDWKRKIDLAGSKGAMATHEAYAAIPAPENAGPALWDHIAKPESWTPERRKLHDDAVARAQEQAKAFADAVEGPPTLYAMRGNTAAGKTRAIEGNIPALAKAVARTKDLRHRAVNPDNFKLDLREADTDIPLTSTQVHNESSMLANRLEASLQDLRRSDGAVGSILIDKRLGVVGDVKRYAKQARDTGRRFELHDIDASLEISLYSVLARLPGGADPVPGFQIIADGFVAARKNRHAVMELFLAEPGLGKYAVYGTEPSGAKKLVAEIADGAIRVADADRLARWRDHDPEAYVEQLAAQKITADVVDAVTKHLDAAWAKVVREALAEHVAEGRTWKQALDAHSSKPPRRRN